MILPDDEGHVWIDDHDEEEEEKEDNGDDDCNEDLVTRRLMRIIVMMVGMVTMLNLHRYQEVESQLHFLED